MPRYSKGHYEVAQLIKALIVVSEGPGAPYVRSQVYSANLVSLFADLFAADNPPVCEVGSNHGPDDICGPACLRGGFGRAGFLLACGLEEERDV
ncbi:hypothetical protein LCGC14_2574110, partial [marine sediment metagenome]